MRLPIFPRHSSVAIRSHPAWRLTANTHCRENRAKNIAPIGFAQPRFSPGRLVAAPNAILRIQSDDMSVAPARHQAAPVIKSKGRKNKKSPQFSRLGEKSREALLSVSG